MERGGGGGAVSDETMFSLGAYFNYLRTIYLHDGEVKVTNSNMTDDTKTILINIFDGDLFGTTIL